MISISPKPLFNTASPQSIMTAAYDQPFNIGREFGESFMGGLLTSPVIGTVIRNNMTPTGAPPADRRTQPMFGTLEDLGNVRGLYDQVMRGVGLQETPKAMTQSEWEASDYARERIAWDPGMTEERAAALAHEYDIKEAREMMLDRTSWDGPFGLRLPSAVAFAGSFAGQAFDPINYIPIFGEAAAAAAVARYGWQGIAKVGALSAGNAVDAAVSTAIFGLLTASQRAKFGDDVSWQAQVSDIAMSALIGATITPVLHGLGSAYSGGRRLASQVKKRAENVPTVKTSRSVLNDAVVGMATNGEVSLSPRSIAALERMQVDAEDRAASLQALDRETVALRSDDPPKAGQVVETANGARVAVKPVLVEASTVQPSRSPSEASVQAVQSIASGLDPARLMPSTVAGEGAPIVGAADQSGARLVASGNTRAEAIQTAYQTGNGDAYRQALEEAGYDTAGYAQPMLALEQVTQLSPEAQRQFAVEANQSQVADLSPEEIADIDRQALSGGTVLDFNGGDVLDEGNRMFVERYLSNLARPERAAVVDRHGNLTADGKARLENALVAYAFGEEMPSVIQRFTSGRDHQTRTIVSALAAVAHRWSEVSQRMKAGLLAGEFDMTPEVAMALHNLSRWRQAAAASGSKFSDVAAAQIRPFDQPNGKRMSLIAKTIARLFYKTDDFGQVAPVDVIAGRLNDVLDQVERLAQINRVEDAEAAAKLGVIDEVDHEQADVLAVDGIEPGTGGSRPPRAGEPGYADSGDPAQGAGGDGRGRSAIAASIEAGLISAGRSADEGKALGAIVSSFYETMAARTGRSVQDLVNTFGVPEFQRLESVDELINGPLDRNVAKLAQAQRATSQQLREMRDVLDGLDATLAGLNNAATKAVDNFVGMGPMARNNPNAWGMMDAAPLERMVRGDDPDGAAELEAAFAPVREQLRLIFGDSLPLYRVQREVPGSVADKGARSVLSWSADPEFSRDWADLGQRMEETPEETIRAHEETYQREGRVKIGPYWLVYEGSQYPVIYPDRRGEPALDDMVTDTDSVRAFIEGNNNWAREHNARYETRAAGILQVQVPLDDVVFATDRAGQSEFMVRNDRSVHIDETGQLVRGESPDPRFIFQPAYHGSPYDFDKFSLDKIGTGEGFQSFGWGLYFAGKKEVAEFYRRQLSELWIVDAAGNRRPPRNPFAKVDDGEDQYAARTMRDVYAGDPSLDRAAAYDKAIIGMQEMIDADEAKLSTVSASWREVHANSIATKRKTKALLEQWRDDGTNVTAGGKLYEVDIPDDDELLDWDKPIAEQPAGPRELLMDALREKAMGPDETTLDSNGIEQLVPWQSFLDDVVESSEDMSVERLYKMLTSPEVIGYDPKAASEFLRDAGIPGHRFLDEQSRNAGNGTYNYVIYDDNRIQIGRVLLQSAAPPRADQPAGDQNGRAADGGAGLRELPGEAAQASGDQGREADGSLRGLPRKVGNFRPSAYPDAQRVAAAYMAKAGLPYNPPNTYARVDPERATRIAAAYDEMKHAPDDPEVKQAYQAMADETLAQYEAMLEDGMVIEFIPSGGRDPYAGNPRNMTEDVRNNKHMWVFSTRDGFGSDATFDPSDNPLLAETQFTISGQVAMVNDIFRAVHDYFGHVKEGVGFRADGEENAWRAHSAMYSPMARRAMTSETRGQNSWVNYGPYGEANRTATSENTRYADQKVGLLPDWVVSEGAGDPAQIKSAIANNGTFSPRNPSILFQSPARVPQQLYEAAVEEPILEAAGLEASFADVRVNTYRTGRELKLALERRVQEAAAKAGIDLTQQNDQNRVLLAKAVVRDAVYALRSNANAVGWYDKTVKQATAIAAMMHPELATDPHAELMFKTALAITSNGQKVDKNFQLTEQAYAYWKQTGRLPEDIGVGTAAQNINEGMRTINQMVDAWGVELTRDFLDLPFTVGQLESMGFQISGEGVDVVVRGAAILGPKIGNGFYSNLNGHFDALTIDRWLMRTWGRLIGRLIDHRPEQVKAKGLELKGFVKQLLADKPAAKAFKEATGIDLRMKDMAALGAAINKASQDSKVRAVMNETGARVAYGGGEEPLGSVIRKVGNALYKYLDGQIEQPTPKQRPFIRAVIGDALQELQKRPGLGTLTMSDLQALLWYPEKRLYDSAKKDDIAEGYTDDEAPDYANAARKLAKDAGFSDDDIAEAIREIDSGRSAGVRPTDGGDARPAPAPASIGEATGRLDRDQQKVRAKLLKRGIFTADRVARERDGAPRVFTGKSAGGDRGLRGVKTVFTPSRKFANTLDRAELKAETIHELEAGTEFARFHEAISASKAASKYGAAVYVYPQEDYATFRLFMTEDGKGGFALKPDGDIVSVFSGGGGSVHGMLTLALEEGGAKLDCFDTVLPEIYELNGFKEVGRDAWNEAYKPDDWDYETFKDYNNGRPDIVYMEYQPALPMELADVEAKGRRGGKKPRTLMQGARGAIQLDRPGQIGSMVSLFADADPSTALHEMGHHFLHMFRRIAMSEKAPAEIVADMQVITRWWASNAKAVANDSPHADVTEEDVLKVLREGTTGDDAKDVAIDVGLQEQWARGFEQYVRSGKAPTPGLKGAFEQFRRWLVSIYRKATDLNVKISPEMKGVFDRMLGMGQEQAIAARAEAARADAPTPKLDATPPQPEPPPEGLAEAAARVHQVEDFRALAEQHGVNEDGSFAEEADIEALRQRGELTEEDEAELAAADAAAEDANEWIKALKTAAQCAFGVN